MEDIRKRLQTFRSGVEALGKEMPDTIKSLFGFIETAQKESVLSVREKELIALGISLYHRCRLRHRTEAPDTALPHPGKVQIA